jgi:hypothetical protein
VTGWVKSDAQKARLFRNKFEASGVQTGEFGAVAALERELVQRSCASRVRSLVSETVVRRDPEGRHWCA